MKRIIAIAALAGMTTACVVDNRLEIEDGLCYRIRSERAFWVIPVTESKVLAVPENCGLPGD